MRKFVSFFLGSMKSKCISQLIACEDRSVDLTAKLTEWSFFKYDFKNLEGPLVNGHHGGNFDLKWVRSHHAKRSNNNSYTG